MYKMITNNNWKGNECGKLEIFFIHLLQTTKFWNLSLAIELWLFLRIIPSLFFIYEITFLFILFYKFLAWTQLENVFSHLEKKFKKLGRGKKIVVLIWNDERCVGKQYYIKFVVITFMVLSFKFDGIILKTALGFGAYFHCY